MDKRNRSQSPAQARKRSTSTTPLSSSTDSQDETSSNTSDHAEDHTSSSGSSEHSSTMRLVYFESSPTSSPHADNTNSSLLPCQSLARNESSDRTPPAVATYAGMITPGPLTPSAYHEPSHDGIVVHTSDASFPERCSHMYRFLHVLQTASTIQSRHPY
jgi:hypothetical protein